MKSRTAKEMPVLRLILDAGRLSPTLFLVASLLTLAVHLAYIAATDWGAGLLPVYPKSDSYLFLHRAWFEAFVAADGGYSRLFVPDTPYLWLLAGAYKQFGPEEWVPFVLNALLAAITAGFVALTTRKLFDLKAAYCAGVLFAFCGPVVFFSGITIKTSLVMTLLATAGYFAITHFQSRSAISLVVALSLLGLAVLDRNNAMVIVVLLAGIVLWSDFGERDWVRGLRDVSLMLALAVMLIGAWGSTTTGVGTRGSPLGVNFYSGNSPESRGGYTPFNPNEVRNSAIGHYLDAPRVAETAAGYRLTQTEVTLYWLGKSWGYYSTHPEEYAVLQLRKAGLLMARYAQGAPEEYRIWRWQRPVLRLAFVDFGLVLSLGVLGMWLARRRLWRVDSVYFIAGALLYGGTVWLFFVTDRLRMPLLIWLLPYAGFALTRILRRQSARQFVGVLMPLIIGYLLSVFAEDLNDAGPGWAPDTEWKVKHEMQLSAQRAEFYALRRDTVMHPTVSAWVWLAGNYKNEGFEDDVPQFAECAIRVAPDQPSGYELLYEHFVLQRNVRKIGELRERVRMVQGKTESDTRKFLNIAHRIDTWLADNSH